MNTIKIPPTLDTYQITGRHFPEDCTLYCWNRHFKVPPWNLSTQRKAQRLPENFITRTHFSLCMCVHVCVRVYLRGLSITSISNTTPGGSGGKSEGH